MLPSLWRFLWVVIYWDLSYWKSFWGLFSTHAKHCPLSNYFLFAVVCCSCNHISINKHMMSRVLAYGAVKQMSVQNQLYPRSWSGNSFSVASHDLQLKTLLLLLWHKSQVWPQEAPGPASLSCPCLYLVFQPERWSAGVGLLWNLNCRPVSWLGTDFSSRLLWAGMCCPSVFCTLDWTWEFVVKSEPIIIHSVS